MSESKEPAELKFGYCDDLRIDWDGPTGGGFSHYTLLAPGGLPKVLVLGPYVPGEPNRDDKALCRLIIAAPELLKASRRALAVLKATGESVRPGNALGALEAAIQKATA